MAAVHGRIVECKEGILKEVEVLISLDERRASFSIRVLQRCSNIVALSSMVSSSETEAILIFKDVRLLVGLGRAYHQRRLRPGTDFQLFSDPVAR